MENRFGVKDLILFSLIVIVIVMVALAMKQFDRQYQVVRDLQHQGQDQLRELVAIHSALEHGAITSATTNPSSADASGSPDPFASLREMRQAGKYDEGDWLVRNFPVQVAKITPLLSTDVYAAVLEARVIESLAYRDPETLNWVPLLATSWKITDNTKAWNDFVQQRKSVPLTEQEIIKEGDCPPADKAAERQRYIDARLKEGRRSEDIGAELDCPPAVTIDFKLRKGVIFSDGSPFSADDVVFTYDLIMNPKVDAPRDRQALERIKSVEKIDDYDVAFKFKEPYFLSFELASGLGVMSKKFYSAYSSEDFNNSLGLLIGTGPYRMETPDGWKPTTGKIELFRNERYWGLPTSYDRLVYYQVENESTELVMYGNGETDAIALQPEQYRLALKRPDLMDRSQRFEFTSPISGYSYIAWNQRRGGKPTVFADKRVRQAMTMLTDRSGICKNILLGYAQPARGPFSPLSKQDDKTLVDWTYDSAKAVALLKAAGFEDRQGNGVLTSANGTPLSFKLSYPNKSPTLDRIMQFVKDGYASHGVDAQLDPVDWTIIEQRLKSREFDSISLGWSAGLEDDIYQMFDSSQMQGDADNFMSYSNPELDAAIRAARSTVDEDQRMPLWHQCERILHEDQPYTFLTIRQSLLLVDKRVQNVKTAATGLNFVGDWVMPLPWCTPVAQQKYK